MSHITIQSADVIKFSGRDLQPCDNKTSKSFVITPDNRCAIMGEIQGDRGSVHLKNSTDTNYIVSISTDNYVLAKLEYSGSKIMVNDNWKITEDRVIARVINNQSALYTSRFFNIQLNRSETKNLNAIAIRINNGSFATLFLSNCELLFIRFNGRFAEKRLNAHINRQIEELVEQENRDESTSNNRDVIGGSVTPPQVNIPAVNIPARSQFLRYMQQFGSDESESSDSEENASAVVVPYQNRHRVEVIEATVKFVSVMRNFNL